MTGKTDKRLHDRTKLKHEEMQAEWDRIFGKKDKPKDEDKKDGAESKKNV